MTTYSSDQQSLSDPTNEQQTGPVLPADQNPESGTVDKEHQAGGDVDPPPPRKIHGVSVRKLLPCLSVLDIDAEGRSSGYSS